MSWCGHGGGPGGVKILSTAPAPGVEPQNCSQPQPRPPTLSAAVCCHQMQTDASCAASPLHTLCYIVIGNLPPPTHHSSFCRNSPQFYALTDYGRCSETGHFLRSRGCMVDDSLSQLFYFDLFISKEYMYDIYLFLPSPRAVTVHT